MHSSLALDAGAFYAGTSFLSSSHPVLFTTPAVLEEVKHIKASFSALEALQDSGRLVIEDPDRAHVDRVLDAARKTGDKRSLSRADVSILSLALQLRTILVTDDYSVANVAFDLGIEVKPATAGKEIKEGRKWIFYCAGCSRTFGSELRECPFCGNKLRRKYRKIRKST